MGFGRTKRFTRNHGERGKAGRWKERSMIDLVVVKCMRGLKVQRQPHLPRSIGCVQFLPVFMVAGIAGLRRGLLGVPVAFSLERIGTRASSDAASLAFDENGFA